MSDAYRLRSKNVILVKDDVGRAKPTTYDLPHESHAFGRAEPADMEGAREVTMHWASHIPRPKPGENCQDFKKLNKMAAKENISTAKDLAIYKRGNDVKLIPPGPLGAQPKVIPSDVIPSFAYGRKSRPSTPINAVVGMQYAAEYEEAADRTYNNYQMLADQRVAKHRVRLTKASKTLIGNAKAQRHMSLTEEPKELFKLTKFKKVPSRLHLDPIGGMPKSQSLPNLQELA